MYYDILLSSITITPQSYCLFITIILKYKHSSSTMLKKKTTTLCRMFYYALCGFLPAHSL